MSQSVMVFEGARQVLSSFTAMGLSLTSVRMFCFGSSAAILSLMANCPPQAKHLKVSILMPALQCIKEVEETGRLRRQSYRDIS